MIVVIVHLGCVLFVRLFKVDSYERFLGEVKKVLIDVVTPIVMKHQQARARVTEEMVDAFMAVRKLQL